VQIRSSSFVIRDRTIPWSEPFPDAHESDDFIDHTVTDTYWGTGIDKRDPGHNVFGLILARLRNRHQIPDKRRVVVLGHSFISHLKTRIDDGSFF
jgi:hypothetical protein